MLALYKENKIDKNKNHQASCCPSRMSAEWQSGIAPASWRPMIVEQPIVQAVEALHLSTKFGSCFVFISLHWMNLIWRMPKMPKMKTPWNALRITKGYQNNSTPVRWGRNPSNHWSPISMKSLKYKQRICCSFLLRTRSTIRKVA